jgi:hypothetical protein
MKHNKTEIEQVEIVGEQNAEVMASDGFVNLAEASARNKADQRALSRTFGIAIRQGTPLEQVFKSATFYNLVLRAFSITQKPALVFRFAGAPSVNATIEASGVAKGIYDLYVSAKGAQTKGELAPATYAVYTKTGIRLDNLAIEFSPTV